MTESVNRRYMPEVDHIRAFAALLVLFYHCLELMGAQFTYGRPVRYEDWLQPRNPIVAIIQEGHTGVSLFIVLSGFILSIGVIDQRISYGKFLLARVLRIYPMLLVCLFIAALTTSSGLLDILTALLQLSSPTGINSPFAVMFWAVAVEFQCYLIFPFLLLFSNERGSRYLLYVIAVAIALRILVVTIGSANARDLSYWTIFGRIDQFCLGMLAARFFVTRPSSFRIRALWPVAAFVAVGAALVIFNRLGGWPNAGWWKIFWPTIEGGLWAGFLLAYVWGAQRVPNIVSTALAGLGAISYSFYLLHYPIIFAVINSKVRISATGNGYYDALLTATLVVLPITIAFATLTYRTIELPFLSLRPRYVDRGDGPQLIEMKKRSAG